MDFKILHRDNESNARSGVLQTDHGKIHTPIFMPVGTLGSVKAVHQTELKNDINADIILGNTYHLYLRPGTDVLNKAGGLHKFISWDRPILTDSGGYQVYSLSDMRKLSEEGVEFRSHIDGSKHFFSPEKAMEIQQDIGADIIMAFDECTPYPCTFNDTKRSMELTHRWLKRSIDHFATLSGKYNYKQTLFPIVQGGTYNDLRKVSAEYISSMDAEGNAIGGLSVGEPAEMMYEITETVCGILPQEKPRYLMGVGTPANILECIDLGIDMFDCVMPTRNARNGMLFTKNGIINIRNEKWKDDFSAIEEDGESEVDTLYNKAYLRHLMISNERLAPQIASRHNLAFYLWLVRMASEKIKEGVYRQWKNKMVPLLSQRL